MAGATLQGTKYVIHARLAQTDFGVTYQATHTYLAQPVILQTLNDVVRQRRDFAEIRQQFMLQVRSLAERPTPRLLDCFEENGFPFAVLELVSGQAPPKLSDWFSLQSLQSLQLEGEPGQNASHAAHPSLAPLPDFSGNGLAAKAELPPNQRTGDAPAAVNHTAPFGLGGPQMPEAATPTNGATSGATNNGATNGAAGVTMQAKSAPAQPTQANSTLPQPGSSPSKRHRLPLAIAMVSLIGGCVGMGMGLALRFEPGAQPQNASGLRSGGLFSREQSFPPQPEWPVAEPPEYYAPEAAEEPIYRTNPPDYFSDPAASEPPDAAVNYAPAITPAPVEATAPTPALAAPSPKSTAPWASEIPPLAPLAPVSPAADAPAPNRASSAPPAPLPNLPTPVAPAPDLPAPLAPPAIAPAAPAAEPSSSLPKRVQMDDAAIVNQ